MIKILKLTSGDTIIGELETDSIDPAVIYDPMIVEIFRDEYYETKLRLSSAVSLAAQDYLVFERKHILTHYTPQTVLVNFYKQMIPIIEEDKRHAEQKIEDALEEIISTTQEKEDFLDRLNEMFIDFNNTKH